jgi:hypothetical protein
VVAAPDVVEIQAAANQSDCMQCRPAGCVRSPGLSQ